MGNVKLFEEWIDSVEDDSELMELDDVGSAEVET